MGERVTDATVAVIGCGIIGASWAKAFLEGGAMVRAWDPNPDACSQLQEIASKRRSRLSVCRSAGETVQGACFVQESGPENLDAKKALLADIAEHLEPDAIFASSTSTFTPSVLQEGSPAASRIIVGHPFNPPRLLPLVEVVPGRETKEEIVKRTMDFYRSLGKHPIRLRRERPGHLANRLQAALWREAVDALAEGQASVEDIDAAVRLALGPRWAVMGPFETFQLGGGAKGIEGFLDHIGPAFHALWEDCQKPVMTPQLRARIVEETNGAYSGRRRAAEEERDRKIAAVLAALSDKR